MKVILTINIGTVDNARLKLPATTEGSVIDCTPAVAAELLARSWAEPEDAKEAELIREVVSRGRTQVQ